MVCIHLFSLNILFFVAKQLDEINLQEDSSDSSTSGGEDEDEEEVMEEGKAHNGARRNSKLPKETETETKPLKFSFETNGSGDPKKPSMRRKTVRRTKQKGYWHNLLQGVFEK
jgi:hypothetical protein